MYGSTTSLGLSAQAIAFSGHTDHPWDPADLRRCMDYCAAHGLTTEALTDRMRGRSKFWDRLLPEWDRLTALLRQEMATATDGRAPLTYQEMKRVLAAGVECDSCHGSGRGTECEKCKGTGKRNGGRCRARSCYSGADFCRECHGRGYTDTKES